VAKKPTIGDILKRAKKESQKKQKQAVLKVKKVTDRTPIKGPPGLGVDIADLASRITQEIVNQASDIAFRDFQNVELPSPGKQLPKTILPNVDQMPGKPTRVRTDNQLINDQIMRDGMQDANSKARKKNGQLKKGMTQKKIARMAQLYCTKERQRLGLCKKPMKRRKRGKNTR
jgi:hypothetical protein